ncbi:hypothetical protein MUO98_02475 [Candidatus Bathyarchaeota archaeon]|nr:hypothetical protein [Candidatus Bathyarchaeota archaeon]
MRKQVIRGSREEKINEEPGKERTGWFIFIGLIISLIGYFIYDYHINTYKITQTGRRILLGSDYPFQVVGLVLIIIGIIGVSIGIIKIVYSRFR